MVNSPLRVLVCDDDRSTVRLIQAILERQGHDTIPTFDGTTCLQAVRYDQPDCVILDLKLPDMDGTDVLRTIRRDPSYSHVPVFVVSARDNDSDVFEAYHCGGDFFLSKPFDPKEIARLVGTVNLS